MGLHHPGSNEYVLSVNCSYPFIRSNTRSLAKCCGWNLDEASEYFWRIEEYKWAKDYIFDVHGEQDFLMFVVIELRILSPNIQ